MLSLRTQCPKDFRRQNHAFLLQFLQRLGHGLAIVEDQQVGDQVVVLDDFQLLVPDVFLDQVGGEVEPRRWSPPR